jgi:hypothetical protein
VLVYKDLTSVTFEVFTVNECNIKVEYKPSEKPACGKWLGRILPIFQKMATL